MALQEHLERLEPFIGDDETRIDGYATDYELGVLTDRQLITLKATAGDESTTTVNATYLDRVEYRLPARRPRVLSGQTRYGINSLLVAFVSITLVGSVDSNGFSAILILVGSGVGILGLALLIAAYDTPADSVAIELQTVHGDVARQSRLDEEYTEFAETLSKTVSNAHVPEHGYSERSDDVTVGGVRQCSRSGQIVAIDSDEAIGPTRT